MRISNPTIIAVGGAGIRISFPDGYNSTIDLYKITEFAPPYDVYHYVVPSNGILTVELEDGIWEYSARSEEIIGDLDPDVIYDEPDVREYRGNFEVSNGEVFISSFDYPEPITIEGEPVSSISLVTNTAGGKTLTIE